MRGSDTGELPSPRMRWELPPFDGSATEGHATEQRSRTLGRTGGLPGNLGDGALLLHRIRGATDGVDDRVDALGAAANTWLTPPSRLKPGAVAVVTAKAGAAVPKATTEPATNAAVFAYFTLRFPSAAASVSVASPRRTSLLYL